MSVVFTINEKIGTNKRFTILPDEVKKEIMSVSVFSTFLKKYEETEVSIIEANRREIKSKSPQTSIELEFTKAKSIMHIIIPNEEKIMNSFSSFILSSKYPSA